MNKSASLYLDFLRVVAAFGVLMVHAGLPWFSNGLFLSEKYGHKFVMIFFVLSGYLIAFTVKEKNKGARRYIIDRVSRLYSVVWPALLLTFILDSLGNHFNPAYYVIQITHDHLLFRYLVNGFFLGQIWALCTKPSSNGPFWSICYEFWYYMLFAAYCYLDGKKRYIAIAAICLLVGYKILILLPVWVYGVWAYNLSKRVEINKTIARILFFSSASMLIILTFVWDFSILSSSFDPRPPFYFSSQFGFDWIYGGIVAINLFSMSFMDSKLILPVFVSNGIKYLSSITFSLYLFHLPMLVLLGALVPFDRSSYWQILLLLGGIIMIAALLAEITEKQRNYWKSLIGHLVSLFQKKPTQV